MSTLDTAYNILKQMTEEELQEFISSHNKKNTAAINRIKISHTASKPLNTGKKIPLDNTPPDNTSPDNISLENHISGDNITGITVKNSDYPSPYGHSVFKGNLSDNHSISYCFYDKGILVFSGKGELSAQEIENDLSAPEHGFRDLIETVIINSGITAIKDCCFKEFQSVKNFIIPNSVTSIGDEAFYSCENITGITLPDELTEIGTWAFCGCHRLKQITIPAKVNKMKYNVFDYCRDLKFIFLKNYNIASSTLYDYGCDAAVVHIAHGSNH